jgi:TrmH RNA methyltransferase
MNTDNICGANAVAALFAKRPDDVQRLFYTAEMKPVAGPYCAVLATQRKPYRMVDGETLEKIAATGHHGGIVAVARPRAIPIFDRDNPPRLTFLLVLDGVGNPHNLGAIARSAAFFGVPGMLIGEAPGNAMPSDAAYRTAEGGLEQLLLFKTRDLPAALGAMQPFYRTVAAALTPDAAPLSALPRDRAVALVLGNEERGISPDVLAACRRHIRIEGSGRVQSLNVAQAAAVLLHALTGLARQSIAV